ncbi:MAG: hypothetical protein ACT452_04085 [Microthrixaceae bacterium]
METERRKLLQAHLSGAVPLDLLKEEQDRIMRELANVGGALASTELHWETIERNLDLALSLVRDCQSLYRAANPETRRQLNQALFEALSVDVDGVKYRRLAQPFAQLLDDDLFARLEREMKNPTSVASGQGSKEVLLTFVWGA